MYHVVNMIIITMRILIKKIKLLTECTKQKLQNKLQYNYY